MLQQWNTVLACLDQPAFIRDASGIRLVNAAAARLGLQVGSDGIPAELPPVEQGPCSCSCRIGEQYWQVQVRDAQTLQLVMLQPLEIRAMEAASAAARALRDPLQQISVVTSKLWPYLEEQEDERIQQGTASITRGLHRLLRVVNNLTDLELQTDLPLLMKKRTLCNGFLTDFAEQVQPLVESTGRRMVLECPDRRFYALMDARMVERALLNLLLNAIQHTPEGGCITLRGSAQSKQCCFVVENEGDVIGEAALAGLFERYKRPELALQSPGAGLGLTVARNVALAHGGNLLARPNPAGGLCVVLTVEMAELRFGEEPVYSPVKIDRFGGFDNCLTELSDVLGDRWFDSRALD